MSGAPKIKLMKDWVLVRHDDSLEKERLSGGGIVVPGGSYTHESEIMCWGEVIAVGPGRWAPRKDVRLPMQTKPGDKVMYNRFNKRTNTGEALSEIIGDEYALLQETKDIVLVEEQD